MAGDFLHIFPEIFLIVIAVIMLITGATLGNYFYSSVTRISALALLLSTILIIFSGTDKATAFNELFISSAFTVFIKIVLVMAGAVVTFMYLEYNKSSPSGFFEFPILVIFSIVGMMVMVSANDFLTLYLGLELQSLSLYILAASNRDSLKSSEAGLKYFILGALASGIMLYGISLVYGFTGTTNFTALAKIYSNLADSDATLPLGVLIGMVMVIIAVCFKVSAVPFHMWTPDVYEGSPTIVTAFFAAVPKVAAVALFIRVGLDAFGGLIDQWKQIVMFVSGASMILGSIAAIRQTNLKRLLAYSSIGHVGYLLIGLAAGTVDGIEAMLIYLVIYVVMSIGMFGCLIFMRRDSIPVEKIQDLAGIARTNPLFALAISVFMLSMAGIPPLAGFFGKFYIFLAAIGQHLYPLAIIGVITSVIGAYYYLNLMRIMYFDTPVASLDKSVGFGMKLILGLSVIFNILYFIYPGPLLAVTKFAAAALF